MTFRTPAVLISCGLILGLSAAAALLLHLYSQASARRFDPALPALPSATQLLHALQPAGGRLLRQLHRHQDVAGAQWLHPGLTRDRAGRALVQSFPVAEVQAGDVPRTSVNAKDGETLCEKGRALTKAQARRLRELGRQGGLAGNAIELELAFPFAPFIAAGALLTAVFAGNLAPPLIDLGIWLRGG